MNTLVPTLLALTGLCALAQPSTSLTHRPDRNRPGPWDNNVWVVRVRPGGEPQKLATFPRAGVPSVARLQDGRLLAAFQHFPADDELHFDRVAVRFSSDEGRSWSKPEPIVVEGMDAGLIRPFDPTLVPLPDGRVRLYFTSNRSWDFGRSAPAIYSAISTNGIHYQFEPGVRFALAGRLVIDCAVALHQGVFHLIVPDNGEVPGPAQPPGPKPQPSGGNGYHAISHDGLKFKRVADVTLASRGNRWLGNLVSDGGELVFFGTGPGAWPVTSPDGVRWAAAAELVRVPGADPGAVRLRDGAWLLLVTSPPRAPAQR
jgi:hypothetical protein